MTSRWADVESKADAYPMSYCQVLAINEQCWVSRTEKNIKKAIPRARNAHSLDNSENVSESLLALLGDAKEIPSG